MIAEYQGNIYFASDHDNYIALVTHNPSKCIGWYESEYDYFYKYIPLDDPELKNLYEIHFWVKYHDCIEKDDIWCVDEGRYVGIVPNIEEGKVVIDVGHDSKDETWEQYDKYAASKMINLSDCEEFIIEKKYIKKNGSKSIAIEKFNVNLETFKNTMITNRSENL